MLDRSLNYRQDPATDVSHRNDPKYLGRVLSAMVSNMFKKVQTTNCSFKVVSESKYEDASQKILGHCLYAPETWARETPRWLSDLSLLDLSHLWYF